MAITRPGVHGIQTPPWKPLPQNPTHRDYVRWMREESEREHDWPSRPEPEDTDPHYIPRGDPFPGFGGPKEARDHQVTGGLFKSADASSHHPDRPSQIGPRGGRFYISPFGVKVYLPR
jgi:hypothetical protein